MTSASAKDEFRGALLRAIHDASPDGILVVDHRGIIVCVNQQFFTAWGIPCPPDSPDELIGSPDAPILQQAVNRVLDPEPFLARVRDLYANPDQVDICKVPLKGDRTLERHSAALRGIDGRVLGRVWYFRDISAHTALENSLRALAETDSLTGTANRRQFFLRASEAFQRARSTARPLSVLMLDLDNFKEVNDRWGHSAGDQVLTTATKAWQQALREQDILSRLGGEEFAVLLPDTEGSSALACAQRLAQALALVADGAVSPAISCTASTGVAELCPDDADFDACLRRADEALYRAKRNGRNRIEVAGVSGQEPTMEASTIIRRDWQHGGPAD